MSQRERNVVRALVVTPEHTVLLIRIVLPDWSFWITPGGGIKADEGAQDALQRELFEETGIETWKIGPEVWTRKHTFEFEGDTVTQHEQFFLVHTSRFTPPEVMPDEIERRVVDAYRWWSVEEIVKSAEDFAPQKLGECLDDLLQGAGVPAEPIDVGV